MKWYIRDRRTNYFLCDDMLTGYRFASDRRKAIVFSSLAQARDKVKAVCAAEKLSGKKALLEAILLSELRRVDQRRYFINRARKENHGTASQDHYSELRFRRGDDQGNREGQR